MLKKKYENAYISIMVEEIMNKAGFDTKGVCINDYYDDRIYMTVDGAETDYYIHFDLVDGKIYYTLYKDYGENTDYQVSKVGYGEYFISLTYTSTN